VHGLRAVPAFLIGTLMREVEAAPTFGGSVQRLADLEGSGLPAVSVAAPYLAACDHEAEFEFGLRIILDAFGEPQRIRSCSAAIRLSRSAAVRAAAASSPAKSGGTLSRYL